MSSSSMSSTNQTVLYRKTNKDDWIKLLNKDEAKSMKAVAGQLLWINSSAFKILLLTVVLLANTKKHLQPNAYWQHIRQWMK